MAEWLSGDWVSHVCNTPAPSHPTNENTPITGTTTTSASATPTANPIPQSRKTRTSQASSSEKLLQLRQELATAAELVASVFKPEQLKHEAHQAETVREKREDFAGLKHKFPSLLNAKDEESSYDREKIRRTNPVELTYVHSCCL